MRYIVEISDPYSQYAPHLTDERYECQSAIEAGETVEEHSPLDAEEVAELLVKGERVSWEHDEGGRNVEAWAGELVGGRS